MTGGAGSNNFVVSGAHTASGLPLLANDTHLRVQMPNIWYEVALHCVDGSDPYPQLVTAACPYQVRGFSFAGVPGVVIGHTDRIAWGISFNAADTADFYVERINPRNPHQYQVNGEWVDMRLEWEQIEVEGAIEPEIIIVRATRHGPIVTDYRWEAGRSFAVLPGEEFPDSLQIQALSMRYTAFDEGSIVPAVLQLNRARSYQEFRSALARWTGPPLNFTYADTRATSAIR